MIPAPAERFKPRAHASALSSAVQSAWEEFNDGLRRDSAEVVEIIARHAAALASPADLAVLRRHGFTDKIEHANVRMHDGEDWKESFGLDLPIPIEVPRGVGSFYAGGPRWSLSSTGGLTREGWQAMTEQERAELMEHHRRHDATLLPVYVELFFTRLVEARRAYRAEYKQATAWPALARAERGEYPTWREIADQFPAVLGAWLRQQWSEGRIAA